MEIIESSATLASRKDPHDVPALVDFWATGKQGNNHFVSTARFFQSNGSNVAELLVSATVPHPKHGGVTALLPLVLLHYPLSKPGEVSWRESGNAEFSSRHKLFAGQELEKLVSLTAADLLSGIQSKGGVSRLSVEPGSIGMGDLTKVIKEFDGETRRLAARKITMSHRLDLGNFHFSKGKAGLDIDRGNGNFTAIELHIGAYFNFLKSIGYLQVREATDKYAGQLLRESEELFTQDELHGITNNRGLFVRALLARISRQRLILNTRAD